MKKKINFRLNGEQVTVEVTNNALLLDVLRNNLKLKGTKRGCETGECGACTVLLDGKPINSCIYLAVKAEGKSILTVEGLSNNGELSSLQNAFKNFSAFQCGFCAPGMLMSTKALLDKNSNPSREDIEVALSGNLCRCTGYEKIINAIQDFTASNLKGEEVYE